MLQRNQAVLWRELAGEAVLLDPQAGCSYNLNQVGTFIWKLLDGAHSPQEIATEIAQYYDIGYEQALLDVEKLIANLQQHNLLLAPPV
ncbi:PqqD family protein [Ktedonosporobacter rubrisoli]|uniref:PqqD family protein n=1 Tax=Ktedonosporobacter rubrisoli TaxID=2509675 RepID=A0A4P6K180_KTERU|nr:PqqD family protein [Ktedonosporobacter rubrisoli]QBD81735.1 PqqD family protein [Ktedonosporobacter rubrisoli]